VWRWRYRLARIKGENATIEDQEVQSPTIMELRAGEREAISLAPWLQPGGQVLQNDS
jgi:hypothetical protein